MHQVVDEEEPARVRARPSAFWEAARRIAALVRARKRADSLTAPRIIARKQIRIGCAAGHFPAGMEMCLCAPECPCRSAVCSPGEEILCDADRRFAAWTK